jgi:phosphocarrier protein HPr
VKTETKLPRTKEITWGQTRGEVTAAYCSTFALTATNGMHLRPAAIMAKTAGRFDCQIQLKCNGSEANAKSLMSVTMLEAMFNNRITVMAEGDDAGEAMAAIAELFATGFGEPAAEGTPNHAIKIDFEGSPGAGSQATRFTAVAAGY